MYLKNFKYVESMGLKTRIIYTCIIEKKQNYQCTILMLYYATGFRHLQEAIKSKGTWCACLRITRLISVTKVDNCDFSVQHRASSSLKNLLHWTSYFLIKIPSNGRQFNKSDGVRHALGSSWRTWPMQVMMGLGW